MSLEEVYYLEIQAITSSFELDLKEKSRSFQNIEMTYDELIGIIVKDYSGYSFTQCIAEGQKIGKPLFQYKETDWSFIKRIASELNSDLYCDIMEIRNMFYFGRPIKASYELEDMMYYKAHKNLKRFKDAGGYDAGYHDTDYFYYDIEKREKYEVGDNIWFKNKQLYINQYSAFALKDEVIYKYRLCRKNGVWQTKIYNSLLSGASIEGEVLEVEGEKVKLHLNIDETQNVDEASWFAYAPPTGNIMYSMPAVGTSARLYFPNESSEEPIITGCVRTNGSSCTKTSDTTKRYLGTEHGSEIEMTPDAINIKGGSKEPLSIKFEDSVGVTLTSHKKLSLNADDEIIIKTPKSVKINAQSQILVTKTGTQSGFSIENEFHILSENVMKNGSDSEAYAPFDDEPKAAVKQVTLLSGGKKEEKTGFNWGLLAKCALVAVAVVASVATFGLGTTLLIGAVMAATAGKYLYTGLEVVGGIITVAAAAVTFVDTGGLGSPLAWVAAAHGVNSIADGIRDINHLANGYNDKVGTENYLRDDVYAPVGTVGGKLVGYGMDQWAKVLTGENTNYTSTMGKVGGEIGYAGCYVLDMKSGYSTVGEGSKVLKDVPKLKNLTSTYYEAGNPIDGYKRYNDLQLLTDGAPFINKAYAAINGSINGDALYYDSNDVNDKYLK